MDELELVLMLLQSFNKWWELLFEIFAIYIKIYEGGYEHFTLFYLADYLYPEEVHLLTEMLNAHILNKLVLYLEPDQILQLVKWFNSDQIDIMLNKLNEAQLENLPELLDLNEVQLEKLAHLLNYEEFQHLLQFINISCLSKLVDNIDPIILKELFKQFAPNDLIKLLGVIDGSYLMKLDTHLKPVEIMMLFDKLGDLGFCRLLKNFEVYEIQVLANLLDDDKFLTLSAHSNLSKIMDLLKYIGGKNFLKLLENYSVDQIIRLTRNFDKRVFYKLKQLLESMK